MNTRQTAGPGSEKGNVLRAFLFSSGWREVSLFLPVSKGSGKVFERTEIRHTHVTFEWMGLD